MVTTKTQYSLRDAEKYFGKHLAVGDYSEKGAVVTGEWFGKGAVKMSLEGRSGAKNSWYCVRTVTRPVMRPSPNDNGRLERRLVRSNVESFTISRSPLQSPFQSPDWSLKIMNVIQAHQRALRVALKEFEAFAATRVRKGKADDDRLSSNVVAALFTHDTSRALDPHLHTHCIVFNATFDPVENRWKALQNSEMLRVRKFVKNVYYHELAKDLRNLGYQIRNQRRGDFEIEGIPVELCQRFSKRHEQIEGELDKLLTAKPEVALGNLKDIKEHLAEARRARKIENISQDDLHKL